MGALYLSHCCGCLTAVSGMADRYRTEPLLEPGS